MRISLRELMIVVAVAAVALAGLKYASTWMMPVVQGLTGLLLLVFLVQALVDRGPQQAFGLGFVSCGAIFLASLMFGEGWRAPIQGFGTARALDELHSLMISQQWVGQYTDKVAYNFQPTAAELRSGQAVRIELKPLPPDTSDKVEQQTDEVAAAANSDSVEQPADVRQGGPSNNFAGGSSFGRGRRGERRGSPLQTALTPNQRAEYDAGEDRLRQHADEVFNDPQGQAAILTGRPLSSIVIRRYTRQSGRG